MKRCTKSFLYALESFLDQENVLSEPLMAHRCADVPGVPRAVQNRAYDPSQPNDCEVHPSRRSPDRGAIRAEGLLAECLEPSSSLALGWILGVEDGIAGPVGTVSDEWANRPFHWKALLPIPKGNTSGWRNAIPAEDRHGSMYDT